jgi:hypothetical protein
MNCPKCFKENICPCGCGLVKKSEEVEMEDKGAVGKRMWEVEDGVLKSEVTKHLYQCPVCKECLIQ